MRFEGEVLLVDWMETNLFCLYSSVNASCRNEKHLHGQHLHFVCFLPDGFWAGSYVILSSFDVLRVVGGREIKAPVAVHVTVVTVVGVAVEVIEEKPMTRIT